MTDELARIDAELSLSVLVSHDDDRFALLGPGLLRATAELVPRSAPLGFCIDLLHLFIEPPVRMDLAAIRASSNALVDDEELRRAVRGVFQSVLCPIAASRTLVDIRDALARHPRPVALDAGGVLTAELARRLLAREEPVAPIGLAAIRRGWDRPVVDLALRGATALRDRVLRSSLRERYDAIALGARRTGGLLGPADVVLAEGAPYLRNRSARLMLHQIAEAQAALDRLLPQGVAVGRRRSNEVATRQHDDSTYPMGGYAEMTQSSSLESVATSELALSETGDIAEDPFAVRWAMGELLSYTRDENVAHRRRISIWIAVSPDIAARAKTLARGTPWQRAVLALAAVCLFAERATRILHEEALSIHIVLPQGWLDEERALLAIKLGALIRRGVVELHSESIDSVPERAAAEERYADVAAFEIGVGRRLSVGRFLAVSDRAELEGATACPPSTDVISSWSDAVRALLTAIP
ncbi:MAG: hypothetical protein HOW73_09815 [Polyangiaceae bacterium]|nr:hypothetical protein [Polyangiaceae bacterium]